jgi:hypothetical protein
LFWHPAGSCLFLLLIPPVQAQWIKIAVGIPRITKEGKKGKYREDNVSSYKDINEPILSK